VANATNRAGTSRTAINEGDRQLRRAAIRFGEEFRLIRFRTGVSQATVARAIGVDRATICRMEAGRPTVADRTRARAAAVLGADFRLGMYPDAAPLIHDAAHARLVEALLRLRHSSWHARVEAPVPGPGRRSTDLRLVAAARRSCSRSRPTSTRSRRSSASAGTRDRRSQPTSRRVLRLPTRRPRGFPASTADIRCALTSADVPWPGDGILWLGGGVQPHNGVPQGRRR
jgi:transcriptional regulator with XRE-family HTH domain